MELYVVFLTPDGSLVSENVAIQCEYGHINARFHIGNRFYSSTPEGTIRRYMADAGHVLVKVVNTEQELVRIRMKAEHALQVAQRVLGIVNAHTSRYGISAQAWMSVPEEVYFKKSA